MDVEKTLQKAMLMREAAAELIDHAEQLELQARIAKAKELPNGELIALLIQVDDLKKKREQKGLSNV